MQKICKKSLTAQKNGLMLLNTTNAAIKQHFL
jgi:hypothetical protein